MGVSFYHTVQSFSQFLLNFVLGGGQLVDQNTANIRAEICMGCHNNLPTSEIKKSGCATCRKIGNLAINSLRSTIIKSNKTPLDGRLLACGICGCDLKISVWIPNETLLSKDDANAYPDFCWKKKILEGTNV